MNRADHYAYHEAELALRRVAQRAAEPHAAFFREVADLVRDREAFRSGYVPDAWTAITDFDPDDYSEGWDHDSGAWVRRGAYAFNDEWMYGAHPDDVCKSPAKCSRDEAFALALGKQDSAGRAIVAPIAPVDGTQQEKPTAEVVTPSDAVGAAIAKAQSELHGYTAPLSQERETAEKFLAMARDLLHRYGPDQAQQKIDAALAVMTAKTRRAVQ